VPRLADAPPRCWHPPRPQPRPRIGRLAPSIRNRTRDRRRPGPLPHTASKDLLAQPKTKSPADGRGLPIETDALRHMGPTSEGITSTGGEGLSPRHPVCRSDSRSHESHLIWCLQHGSERGARCQLGTRSRYSRMQIGTLPWPRNVRKPRDCRASCEWAVKESNLQPWD
jgi:hypothetical protein